MICFAVGKDFSLVYENYLTGESPRDSGVGSIDAPVLPSLSLDSFDQSPSLHSEDNGRSHLPCTESSNGSSGVFQVAPVNDTHVHDTHASDTWVSDTCAIDTRVSDTHTSDTGYPSIAALSNHSSLVNSPIPGGVASHAHNKGSSTKLQFIDDDSYALDMPSEQFMGPHLQGGGDILSMGGDALTLDEASTFFPALVPPISQKIEEVITPIAEPLLGVEPSINNQG